MFRLDIDLGVILDLKQNLQPKTNKILQEAALKLSAQAHAHIIEEVQANLHSSREKYLKALSEPKLVGDAYVISLDQSAMWIEQGLEEHEMIDDLLSSPKAKTSKDGSKYLSVPFQHNKGPTQQTQAASDLTNTIKSELKRRNIPYAKIETDNKGNPKTGLLHKLDILKAPTKTQEGPGQGKGPVGSVRQGPTGIPFLQSIRIYQQNRMVNGKMTTQRSVMTFRTVSSKMKGSGRWVHPGVEAKNFFNKTRDWALREWTEKIVPEVLEKFNQSF